jgi:hypothetical protein
LWNFNRLRPIQMTIVVLQIFSSLTGDCGSRALGPVGFGGTARKDRSATFVFPKEKLLHLCPQVAGRDEDPIILNDAPH